MNKIWVDDLYRYEGEACRSLKTRLKYMLCVPGFQFTYYFTMIR